MRLRAIAGLGALFACVLGAPTARAEATVLDVHLTVQEQNDWCWAASGDCILAYIGHNFRQCDIVNYARSVSTVYNYGTVDCCTDPNQGCDQGGIIWGGAGSVQDVFQHWGLMSHGVNASGPLLEHDVAAAIAAARPFVILFVLADNDGHAVVGYGYDPSNSTMYYMNPWPGEGMIVQTYDSVVSDCAHTWQGTLVLDSDQVCGSAQDGTGCEWSDKCPGTQSCSQGICRTATSPQCPDSGECMAGICNPVTLDCVPVEKDAGAPCDGGTCLAGECFAKATSDGGGGDASVSPFLPIRSHGSCEVGSAAGRSANTPWVMLGVFGALGALRLGRGCRSRRAAKPESQPRD